MIAYTSRDGQIVQILVDVGADGQPLLPHNTTVEAPPAATDGHYVALVDGVYHQIPITVPFFELSYLIQQKVDALNTYADWYYGQPVTSGGIVYDADTTAKSRFAEAKLIYDISGVLPPFWVAHDNSHVTISTITQITTIIMDIAVAFLTRFSEVNALKTAARAATTEAGLDAIIVPRLPMPGM